MNFRRTFYPVGQGAFYVEEFKLSEDSKFTIVYDCGSLTLNQEEIKERIEDVFCKGHQIDILFISHFHADHINGIEALKEHCKIRRVVLPLINNDEETILEFSNYIETKKKHSNLIRNPKRYFGEETIIIKIRPIDTGANSNEEETRNILDVVSDEELPSGTIFTYPKSVWVFIPFNYKQNERRIEFEKKLRYIGKGLSLEDIKTIDDIKKYGKELKQAYEAVEGDLNENSMILYSGLQNDRFFSRLHPKDPKFHRTRSGCLYTGDINLKKKDAVNSIKNRLTKVLPFIGILQVPHHGSKYNFEDSILKLGKISNAIISFGLENKYGHPALTVIRKILASNVTPCFVDENQNKKFEQEGIIHLSD